MKLCYALEVARLTLLSLKINFNNLKSHVKPLASPFTSTQNKHKEKLKQAGKQSTAMLSPGGKLQPHRSSLNFMIFLESCLLISHTKAANLAKHNFIHFITTV